MSNKIITNVITGFLGVGKTTAILNVLQHNRSPCKWAVLVNEFGEVGIDGALLAASGFAIKEVPGGCMCCAAGLPTRVALNKLIREAKPDRILIEPTGLGHPARILQMLTSEDYADVLDVRATLTLIDPRVLQDSRYTGNDNFIGQLQAADVLVANKTDLCSPQQLEDFQRWAKQVRPDAVMVTTQQGKLDPAWLDLPRQVAIGSSTHQAPSLLLTPQFSQLELPASVPMLRKENSSGGFHSCGWIFDQHTVFSFDKVFALLNNLDVLRCKAALMTDRGGFAFNLLEGALTVSELPSRADSRIEFIAPDPINWLMLEEWIQQARL